MLTGLLVYLVRRLQSVPNAAVRLTYHLCQSNHITDGRGVHTAYDVVPRMYHVCRLMHPSNKTAYTFVKLSRRRNRQSRRRRFWVHDVLRRRDDLGEYSRLVQELPLDSARSHGYFRMSTEEFDYVLGLVGPYISVYQLCTWQCTRRDARRRTQCERHFSLSPLSAPGRVQLKIDALTYKVLHSSVSWSSQSHRWPVCGCWSLCALPTPAVAVC